MAIAWLGDRFNTPRWQLVGLTLFEWVAYTVIALVVTAWTFWQSTLAGGASIGLSYIFALLALALSREVDEGRIGPTIVMAMGLWLMLTGLLIIATGWSLALALAVAMMLALAYIVVGCGNLIMLLVIRAT